MLALTRQRAYSQAKAYTTILSEREGPIALIKINRPKALNALNLDVIRELNEELKEIEADKAIKVAVLTGEGKAFAGTKHRLITVS